jgi:regulator of protease activity HflC (stomatin/prohibitin superfamily)
MWEERIHNLTERIKRKWRVIWGKSKRPLRATWKFTQKVRKEIWNNIQKIAKVAAKKIVLMGKKTWKIIRNVPKKLKEKIVEEVNGMTGRKILITGIKSVLVLFGIAGVTLLLESKGISEPRGNLIPGSICLAILAFSLLPWKKSGLKQINENERLDVEFFGEFYEISGPGLAWVIPILTKARERVSLSEQRYRLWEPPEVPKIDFMDGSAKPVEADAFVQVIGGREWLAARAKKDWEKAREEDKIVKESVYKVVYAPRAVKGAATSTIENAARSYLNSLDIDSGIEQGKAGYDLITNMKKEGKEVEANGVKDALANWGIKLNRVTVGDYDLDEKTIAARRGVYESGRAAKAAKQRALQKAQESGGMHGAIKQVLVDDYHYPPIEAENLAGKYVELWKVTEEKALKQTQLQFQGGGEGGFYPELAKFVATVEVTKEAVRTGQGETGKKKGEKKEKEEEKEEVEED